MTEDGTRVHTADNVCPLNVANTDNRLIATATPIRVESFIGNGVARIQRGFLPVRFMLANLVDVDSRMRQEAFGSEQAGAVFFDFAEAFPSLEHAYLHRVSRYLVWPQWLLKVDSVP